MARSDGARSRYAQAFTSSIFEPNEERSSRAFVPAGKRRDQTTSEMFGNYAEKDLRGMPKTFVPKGAELTARQKKLQFLSSEVLPCSSYPPEMRPARGDDARPVRAEPAADDNEDEAVDAVQRRQADLSSKLFGRETPGYEQANAERLMPNDFKWHNHPRKKADDGQAVGHSDRDRAYQEKCSKLFDHQSPQMQSLQGQQLTREEDEEAEAKKRTNLHYSDLFDRPTPWDLPAEAPFRRAKHQSSDEDQIIIHQDWTDSKTELMGGHSARPEHPALRKSDELHQARIFGNSTTFQPPERLSPVTHDNSQKLTKALGQSGQSIHQAHLRTSITPDEFYQEAETIKHWEVAELHISGLPGGTDDAGLRGFCQGFDLQIVKVVTETDPVSNCCKGRAKVMVRYNPKRGSVGGLVRKFQDSNLRVEV